MNMPTSLQSADFITAGFTDTGAPQLLPAADTPLVLQSSTSLSQPAWPQTPTPDTSLDLALLLPVMAAFSIAVLGSALWTLLLPHLRWRET